MCKQGVGCSRSKPKLIDLLIAFQLLYNNVAARKQGYVCYTTQVFEMHIAATTNVESFITLCFFNERLLSTLVNLSVLKHERTYTFIEV